MTSKQEQRYYWFIGESITSFCVFLSVVTGLALVVYTPNHAGISAPPAFLLSVYAYSCVGVTLGQTLSTIHGTIIGSLIVAVEASIGISIAVNKWIQIPVIFIVTFLNLYLIESASNPAVKSLTVGISVVIIILYGSVRVETSLSEAVIQVWYFLATPLLGCTIAIILNLLPFPGIATVSLVNHTEEIKARTANAVKLLSETYDLATQPNERVKFSKYLHFTRFALADVKTLIKQCNSRCRDATWELIILAPFSTTALSSSDRIQFYSRVIIHAQAGMVANSNAHPRFVGRRKYSNLF